MLPSKYKPEYCKLLIAHMKQGYSYETICADLEVGLSTIYDWEAKHPEWKEAKAVAFMMAQKYYEQRLIAKTTGIKTKNKDFDQKLVDNSCLIFALKTRFHKTYGERQKIEQETALTVKDPVQVNITTSKETRTLEDIESE